MVDAKSLGRFETTQRRHVQQPGAHQEVKIRGLRSGSSASKFRTRPTSLQGGPMTPSQSHSATSAVPFVSPIESVRRGISPSARNHLIEILGNCLNISDNRDLLCTDFVPKTCCPQLRFSEVRELFGLLVDDAAQEQSLESMQTPAALTVTAPGQFSPPIHLL